MANEATLYCNQILRISSAELYQCRTKFWKLLDFAECAVFVYQSDRFRYVNSAAEALSGYSHQELLSMNLWDIVNPKTVATLCRLERQRRRPVFLRHQLELVTKTGKEHRVNLVLTPIKFEGQPAVMGIAFKA